LVEDMPMLHGMRLRAARLRWLAETQSASITPGG
jgi:hypothetical protein